MNIDLPHNLWSSGSKIVSLRLPDAWQADVVRMAGHNKPALTEHDYRRRLASLELVIRGGKEICILFDDLSRPTRTYRVMPALLELFDTCGVRDEQVRFICALGTHAPLTNVDFRKKLGAEVLERFPVYNHNPYENCTDLGRTKLGTPVLLNKEYVSCDVRIGIGSCVPHSFCGLGGGYKLVMPGVAHVDSISYHHGTLFNANRDEFYVIGRYRGNPLLTDLREAGGKAPLHAKIDLLVNAEAEAVDMYAGDPEGIDEAWCEKAVAHYRTPFERKADIVFVNTYAKGNEAVIAVSLAEEMLKDEGGDVVLLCDVPEGQVVHYLLGRFGKDIWGRLAFGERVMSPKTRRLFLYSRSKDLQGSFWFGPGKHLTWCNDLPALVDSLEKDYRGRTPTVFVVPDGTIQTARFADKA